MAESLESLVAKFRQNLTEKIRKLEEENHEKKATLEAKHEQEMALLCDKEKVEKEEFDAKQSLRRKDLTVKQHQEKENIKNEYDKKLKATKENKMCPNTSNQEVPECPVCLEPMDPPMRIFQCSQGHYLCEDCYNKEIKSCPTCRRQIVGRNIGMEQAIELMGASITDRPAWRHREVAHNQGKTGWSNPKKSLILTIGEDTGLGGRGNVWECSACTFHNREDKSICQMCGKIMVQPIVTLSPNDMRKDNPNLEANKLGIFAVKPHKKENYVDKQMQKPETKLSNSKTSSVHLFRQSKPVAQFPHNRLANSSSGNGIRKEKLHCPCPPYCPNCLNIVKMENME